MANSKQPKVWILLADAEHARVVAPAVKQGQFLTEVTFKAPGTVAQHGGASRVDPHAQAKTHYAQALAAELARHANAFDQLVLAAPPHTLHDLRSAISGAVAAKVVDSINKDLVKLNDHDVSAHLAKWWLVPA